MVNNNNRKKSRRNASVSNNLLISRMVQRAIERNVERKTYDFGIGQSIGTAGTLFAITQPIIQGITGGQRIGDNIKLKRITMKIGLLLASAVSSCTLRCILFLDKQGDGVYPTAADLLNPNTPTGGWSAEQIKEKRFHIIYDKIIGLGLGGPSVFVDQKDFSLNNTVYYEGVTSVQASNGKNSLYMYCVSTDNVAPPSFNADVLVQYTDA